jgi:hypothetical protein
LNTIPINVFSDSYFRGVQASIDEFYSNDFLGQSPFQSGNITVWQKDEEYNKEWREILSKNLYSAYAPKLVEQAMYVFRGSEWKNVDIEIIRREVKTLKNSKYLGATGIISSFNEIDEILNKFDEVNLFINSCKGFAHSNYNLESIYPDVSDKIIRSKAYISSNFNNNYLGNCTRLKNELSEISEILFKKHIGYLTKKIHDNGVRYNEFDFQSDYSNAIYTPLRNQVDALDNKIYEVSESLFSNGYNNVWDLLSRYNRDALLHYKNIMKD